MVYKRVKGWPSAEPPCIELCWEPPGLQVFAEFLKTPCFYTEQGEIIVNKISTINQCARDITGHFASIAAEGPEGDDKTEIRVRIFWRLFRFMQAKRQKEFT